jgi:N-acetylglutamate synthase-like GNAT family acetyltransferase
MSISEPVNSNELIATLLSRDMISSATETMSKAFHGDPLWQYLYPNEQKRQRALATFFKAVLTLSINSQQAYGIGSPPVGVAVWNFPGQNKVFPSVTALARLLRLAISSFAIVAYNSRNIFAQFERMQKTYASEPHYYLQTIGIRPDFQGHGLSSRLIRPFLDGADTSGVSSYTETMTPANVSLYEHFGFSCLEQYSVPNTQLNIWAFYRTPRK